MANDFFEKYTSKGNDDIQTLAQEADARTVEPAAQVSQPAQSGEPSMRFEQSASNGFVALAARTSAPSAAHAAPARTKTIAGIPVMYLGIGAAAIVLLLAIFFFTGRGKSVQAFDGWAVSEVELWANENKVKLRVDEAFSDEIEAGKVLSQTPAKNERISSDEFLTVVVSSGPDLSVMVPVPDILNMSMNEVEAWAKENKMSTVRITTQASETVPMGKAIEFKINDNTVIGNEIRRDTPFYVIFSKGKGQGEAVKIPNFLAMSVDEANAFAAEKEIVIVVEEEFSETVAKGNIIRQSVKADETIYTGESVTLIVSKGKEVIMPNFYSLSRELAEAKAAQLGITTLVEEKYSTREKDVLISQSVGVGTLYNEDDIVVLVYSLGNKFVVPSFVGQNEADVRAWIEPRNEQGAALTVTTTYTENPAAAGTILNQDKVDYTIGIDGNIQFVVSKGMPVIVPNFVTELGANPKKADVLAKCEELGLVPIFVEEANPGCGSGEVWDQSVPAGTELKQGDTITIKVTPVNAAEYVPATPTPAPVVTEPDAPSDADSSSSEVTE